MSTSIEDGNWAIGEDFRAVSKVENNVFANALIGTTIQDGGKRERSNKSWCNLCCYYLFLFSIL